MTGETGDDGMSLVELIMYVLIGALFLGLVATLFASSLRSGEQTRDRDAATGTAQVVAESLQTSVRNASDVHLADDILLARVATGSDGWECRAWALRSGELRYTTSSAAIPVGTTEGWTALATGVTGTGPDGTAFSVAEDTVSIGYRVAVGEATATITTAVTAQARSEGAVPACW